LRSDFIIIEMMKLRFKGIKFKGKAMLFIIRICVKQIFRFKGQ